MSKKYILAHDLGTSGNKATLYDFDGNLKASTKADYSTYYPQAAWVEQDPDEWWHAINSSTKQLISDSGINSKEIACITFSAQMMGCLPVDIDGNPLRKSIIWADMRAVEQEKQMIDKLGMEKSYKITGHRLSCSYTAAKLLWIKENEAEIYAKTHKILQAKDYIIHKLTGKFVTDYSDASGTNLFDIKHKKWSEEILEGLDINISILPELHASTDVIGGVLPSIAEEAGLSPETPVVIGGGDGSCAAVGAGVIAQGDAYNVLGSSSWIATASMEPVFDDEMRTFNWVHLDENLYSPCGTMQAAGYSYKWLKENLCKYEEVEAKTEEKSVYEVINNKIKDSIPGANGLIFLPYLLGERSPRWNSDAKAAFIGLTINHEAKDLYRSVLEGVAYNLKVILDIFDNKESVSEITMIGGGAQTEVWLQILADIFGKELVIPKYLEEATSMGAAICGGVGIGVFDDFSVIKKFNTEVKRIIPNKETEKVYQNLYSVFNKSYEALIPIYKLLNK